MRCAQAGAALIHRWIMQAETFRVGVSRDFLTADGTRSFDDEAWRTLQACPGIDIAFLEGAATQPVTAGDVQRFDAVLIKRNPVSRKVIEQPGARLRFIGRNGAGYDHIDIDACSRAGIMVSV